MSDEIRPAITQDGWKEIRRIPRWSDDDTESFIEPQSGQVGMSVDGQYVTVDDPHRLAALCLHGQPFGFTHEDVENLHYLYGPWAESLAARIAALLPPLASDAGDSRNA